nr:ChaN family lipoprotein [uncultured Flavobacterium sp.]
MKKAILFMFLILGIATSAQEVKPYQIYNSKGKKISFEKMISGLTDSDVVLFGEFHDNSIVHWLQLKTAKALKQKTNLIFGMEMLETDNQTFVDLYLKSDLSEEDFAKSARLWNNYKTDYKPIVDYAKANQIEVIASNVPRKYASLLYKQGEEALLNLPEDEKQWIAPLPFPYDASLPSYVKMMEMFKDSDHANQNFPKAQAIKDATMAHFIVTNLKEEKTLLHINGSYHSNNYEGIYWYLKKYDNSLKVKTITVLEKADITKISSEEKQLADYIIIIDEDMIKTY